MENNNELNNLTCPIKDHNNMKVIGFCSEQNCLSNNKFACQECVFDNHWGHKLIKIEKLNDIIQNKLKDYKIYIEEEKKNSDLFAKYEQLQASYLDQLKKRIISEIDEQVKEYKELLKRKMKGINNNNDKLSLNVIKNYEKFFDGNAAPVQRPDLVKLSQICSSILKDKDRILLNNNENDFNNKNYYEELTKSTEEFLKIQYLSLSKFLKQNFLIPKSKFEWCKKTYGGYDFFYELANNNTKATKKMSQGTMTVIRSKEPIYDNHLYKIKFRIGLKNMGDFDVGIGTDKTGESCWLRTKESICISNTGVINMDINDNTNKLKDKDIVDLEINTTIGNKTFKGSINNKLVCLIEININNPIFIMAAMRNVGSFIELESYEMISLED